MWSHCVQARVTGRVRAVVMVDLHTVRTHWRFGRHPPRTGKTTRQMAVVPSERPRHSPRRHLGQGMPPVIVTGRETTNIAVRRVMTATGLGLTANTATTWVIQRLELVCIVTSSMALW